MNWRATIFYVLGVLFLAGCSSGAGKLGSSLVARNATAILAGVVTGNIEATENAEDRASPSEVLAQAQELSRQLSVQSEKLSRQSNDVSGHTTHRAGAANLGAVEASHACVYQGSIYEVGQAIGGDLAPLIDISQLHSNGARPYDSSWDQHTARRCNCSGSGWKCIFT